MPTLQEQKDFIAGPQTPIGSTYFDQIFVTKVRQHGEACPVDPPADTDNTPIQDGSLTTSFNNLHYYDLPLCLYIAYRRTGDVTFLTLFRKAADSWWKHPTWINEGKVRLWPDSATPPPRHAGLGGLILRALDGRPEMWDWIVNYEFAHLDIWCKSRINNAQLWYGPREVAFTLQFAAWIAYTLPDSYPNASQIRARLIADLENLVVNYTGRLQYPDGSWRDSSEWVDRDGGTMISSMQPFIVGLLIAALVDVHQVVVNIVARDSAKNQILKACRHLYSDGPYAKDLVDQRSGRRVRGFHYFYHGGTTVNPTKYEKGDMVAPWADIEGWWLSSARQAISTILPSFGYAYKISGDEFYKAAGEEMFDSAYNGTDGARAMMDNTAKNFNQHARRVGSYLAWAGGVTTPTPDPIPDPPTKTPSPDGTKGSTIIDSQLATWTLSPSPEFKTLRDSVHMGGGQGTIYKYFNKVVYIWGDVVQVDPAKRNWYKWAGSWVSAGSVEPGGTPTPIPTPDPTPVPVPPRTVNYPKQLSKRNPILEAQWAERFRLKKENDNGTAVFEKVPV